MVALTQLEVLTGVRRHRAHGGGPGLLHAVHVEQGRPAVADHRDVLPTAGLELHVADALPALAVAVAETVRIRFLPVLLET